MGGGSKRRPNKNNNKTKIARKGSKPDPKSSGRFRNSLFVEGGILSDWQLESSSVTPLRGRNSNQKYNSGSKYGNSDSAKPSTSKAGPRKSNGNTFAYQYPSIDIQGGMHPEKYIGGNDGDDNKDVVNSVVLVDSSETRIVAYLDQTPPSKPQEVNYNYEYSPCFVLGADSHRGLGFCNDSEASPSGIGSSSKQVEEHEGLFSDSPASKEMDAEESTNFEEDVDVTKEMLAETSFPKTNSGFLSIGSMKFYTQDLSDEGSDDDADADADDGESDDEISESLEEGEVGQLSESDSSGDLSDTDLDIDEEVVEDYLEGVGGSGNVLGAKWLLEQDLDGSDDGSSSSSCFDQALEKLGGISLQDASREYGEKKSRSGKNNTRAARDVWSSAMDDLMVVKDPRTVSGRKKHVSWFLQSWPLEAQKGKTSRKFPGAKKKHRKEMIAVKRRERMLRRGVDLEQINSKLEQIVLDEVDTYCFPTMHHRDCSQVRRLAAIYRLSSGCQGSGKKSFVTVTRTRQTCMPASSDKLRLEKLIGAGNENVDFPVIEGSNRKSSADRSKMKKIAKSGGFSPLELHQSTRSKSLKNSARHRDNGETSEGRRRRRKESYASQPVSFVSSGALEFEKVGTRIIEADETKGTASSGEFGAFEVHTKGFGSKMMAKMGFIGGGLGKDGQGLAEPIEVIKRPKSLGLGADFSGTGDNSDLVKIENKKIGTFEKHTKGFGSKLMAKMGFIEGMGLGKDSQGIVHPLVAVRHPKSRGLGAKG